MLELGVIVISGGAGLRVAYGILRPGLYARCESVALAGRSATLLACGCVPLLMIAGTLEGFVSPSSLPDGLKFLIGLTTGILLYLYLFLCARSTGVGKSGGRRDGDGDAEPRGSARGTQHYQGGRHVGAVG